MVIALISAMTLKWIMALVVVMTASTLYAAPSTVSNQLLLGASPKLAACLVKTPQLPVRLSSVVDDPMCCNVQGDESARISCLHQTVTRIKGLMDFVESVSQAREVESLLQLAIKSDQLKKFRQKELSLDEKMDFTMDTLEDNIKRVTEYIKSIPSLLRCLGYLDNTNLG